MARPSIKLYVDVVSPFAYIMYHILRHNPVFSGCDVTYVPIFLGGLMKACNNTAPIHIKNKDRYIGSERLRWAGLFNVPIAKEMPVGFPPMTLSLMRHMAVLENDQARLTSLLDTLFAALWARHEEVYKPEVFQPLLAQNLGPEECGKVTELAATEGKRKLQSNTDQAFADGAFGLPWVVCDDGKGRREGFWGVDHLGQIAEFLSLERPHTKGWRSLL